MQLVEVTCSYSATVTVYRYLGSVNFRRALMPRADMNALTAKTGRSNGGELGGAERRQVFLRFNALVRYWENVHYQYRQDLYDEVEFAKQKEAWKETFENGPAITAFWCDSRLFYSPEFMAELDNLLPPNSC